MFHGVFAQVECGGDAGNGVMLAIEKNERFAVALGQFFQRLPDERGFLCREDQAEKIVMSDTRSAAPPTHCLSAKGPEQVEC